MKFASIDKEGVVILQLDGAILGGPEANALNDELHNLIDSGKNKVVVDLAKVTLMNSSGLGVLIGGYSTLKNAGGSMALANANQRITTLISITKLGTIFPVFSSLDEAIASL